MTIHRVLPRIRLALNLSAFLLLPAVASAASPQVTCINALNKDFRGASWAQAKDNALCVRDAQRGLLVGTAEACLTADRNGKVDKAIRKAFSDDFNLCGVSPSFGPTEGEDGAERAAEKELAVVAELFGSPLDAALLAGSDEKSCQYNLLRAANKCGDARIKEFVGCKKTGTKAGTITNAQDLEDDCLGVGAAAQPDPKGKIAKKCNLKIASDIEGCGEDGVDLAAAVPGCGTASPTGLYACMEARIDCEMCKLLNAVDGLERDCDLFDDGAANGSCEAVCGNNVEDLGEQCDDGNTADGDGCRSDCTDEICGDGIIDSTETCDDGDTDAGDGCSATCAVETGFTCAGEPSACDGICGDGLLRGTEACDDDDLDSGDGCGSTCAIETGYSCGGEPSACVGICGDGLIRGTEACDDDDLDSGDGCSSTCTIETGFTCSSQPSNCLGICGDGLVRGNETCDDFGTAAGDGCNGFCLVELGYECSGEPSSCDGICGDGLIFGAEACDDGDAASGDGCSSSCTVETGFSCTGVPSSCVGICGDSLIRGTEECDDGGTAAGDGCDPSCELVPGYTCTGEPSFCSAGCGDGVISVPEGEVCDDMNLVNGDGCSDNCAVETGYSCTGAPSSCVGICGDGLIRGTEVCDDDDTDSGDGCSGTCTVETGFSCGGEPSACNGICGDGLIRGAETCDDDDTDPGDGCSGACATESGWECFGQPSVCNLLCGNGVENVGEDCDLGGGNSNAPDATCRLDCTDARCGDEIVDPGVPRLEECDDGVLNSNAPNASCRTNCTLPICGDGIVDNLAGEECETNAHCGVGQICGSCMCETPLGTWTFGIAAGSSANCPADTISLGSFIKARGIPTGGLLGAFCTLSRGNFSADANLQLYAGEPDVNGIADVNLVAPRVIRVQQPSLASDNWICVRAESGGTGWVDCDGGSNANSTATVDSNTTAAPPAPGWDNAWFTAPSGVTNSGAGAALIPVKLKVLQQAAPCPGPGDAAWTGLDELTISLVTGTTTATITDARQCPGGSGVVGFCPASPYVVTLTGVNLSCASWTTQTGKALVAPLFLLDQDFGVAVGVTLGIGDIAAVARLNSSP